MRKSNLSSLWQTMNNYRAYGLPFEQTALLVLYTIPLKWAELSYRGQGVFDSMYSLGDLALTFGRRRTIEEVGDYASQIEDLLPGERGRAYTGAFIKCLEMLMRETKGEDAVRNVFSQVESIVNDRIEVLSEIAKVVLEEMYLGLGRGYMEGIHNLSVTGLQSLLADCDSGMSVYDGFCGSGLLALETAGEQSRVILQDINQQALSVAVVMCLLSGNEKCELSSGDSLLYPAVGKEGFDRIVTEIPVGMRYNTDYIRAAEQSLPDWIPPVNGETVSIAHVLSHLKEDGKAVVMVPLSFLYKSGKTGLFREWMASNNYIKQVIELPGGFSYNTSTPFALLVISKEKGNGDIFLLNAKTFFHAKDRRRLDLTEDKMNEIVRICNAHQEIEGISKVVPYKTIARNEYNLTSEQYVVGESALPARFTDFNALRDRANTIYAELANIDKQLDELRKVYVSV